MVRTSRDGAPVHWLVAGKLLFEIDATSVPKEVAVAYTEAIDAAAVEALIRE